MFLKNKGWALVLSGGGAKGLAHVGVLKCLDEHGLKPDMIAGTSVGAIMGSMYCCGMSGLEIENFVVNDFDYKECFELASYQFLGTKLLKLLQFGEGLRNLIYRSGVDSGNKIHNKIFEMTEGKKFGEEEIPFYCNSIDILRHRQIVHDSGVIADAVRASISVPGLFAPFKTDDAILIDGGVFENMPVFIPRTKGIKKVVAVNLNDSSSKETAKFETGADVVIESLFVASKIKKREKIDEPDVEIIATDSRPYDDFSNPEKLIALGYEKTKEKLEEIELLNLPFFKKLFRKRNKT
ncbi:MAG: patatin-like phospholipase family protein [bacterium]